MYTVDITRKGFIWFDNFLINLSLYWPYHFNKLVLLFIKSCESYMGRKRVQHQLPDNQFGVAGTSILRLGHSSNNDTRNSSHLN